MKKTAAVRRAELIARAKKIVYDDPKQEKTIIIPKLSKIKFEPRFCKCTRCRLIFANDVHTMHAPCPKCHAVMENVSEEAAVNLKKEWDEVVKNQ